MNKYLSLKEKAESGNANAAYELALLLQKNNGGRPMPSTEEQMNSYIEEVLSWYRTAAEKGCQPAQYDLAFALLDLGENCRKLRDVDGFIAKAEEGMRWFKTAIDGGYRKAVKDRDSYEQISRNIAQIKRELKR